MFLAVFAAAACIVRTAGLALPVALRVLAGHVVALLALAALLTALLVLGDRFRLAEELNGQPGWIAIDTNWSYLTVA